MPHAFSARIWPTNFRCFDEAGFLIERVTKVTIFIGKNNSGKSAVLRTLDIIAKVTGPEKARELIDPVIDPHCGTDKPLVASVMLPLLRLLPGTSQDSPVLKKLQEFVRPPSAGLLGAYSSEFAQAEGLARVPAGILNTILKDLIGGYQPGGEKPFPLADCSADSAHSCVNSPTRNSTSIFKRGL